MKIIISSLILVAASFVGSAEIRNRQDCYKVPTESVKECLNAVRSGRAFQADLKEEQDSIPASSPAQGAWQGRAKSLEERSVEAQERAVKAQESIAAALWTGIVISIASSVILIVAL